MSFPDRHWYRLSWLSIALLPLAALFRLASALRRCGYQAGLLPRHRLPVPVIVVGNITAGGAGKTPLVLWLCAFLQDNGHRPGIVSRGYGGAGAVRSVSADADPRAAGDEPVLLARNARCPVWIGKDRVAAARALLLAHPECSVIVSDDGLQHYPLRRDLEIAVIDGMRGLGNGLPLPAGPLREPARRLEQVDAVVVNGGAVNGAPNRFSMSLEGATFRNLLNPDRIQEAGIFRGRNVHAVAGIGNPQRFFRQLQRLGLDFTAHAYADHHAFTAEDLEFAGAEAIIMTEKDAIKCQRFALETHWVLPVEALLDPGFGRVVLDKLKRPL